MAQSDSRYFASYCRLDLVSEDQVAEVNGDGVSVGLELKFRVEHYTNERGKECVRGIVSDMRDKPIGFLPATLSRRVCDLSEEGWKVRIAASAVAFTESTRSFWAEVAVFCYEPEYEKTLGAFVKGCMKRVASDERPDIKLSEKMIDSALEDKDFYKTVRRTSYPKLKKGESYYKRHRTNTEKMVIAGSNRNPGCIVGTVAFYVVVIAIVVFVIYKIFFH